MRTIERGGMAKAAAREAFRAARFWRTYHARRYAILFYMLPLTMVVMPVAATFRWNVTAIEGCLASV